jgi:murein DD-endopeptidase MepM/ murein hydrolase activator NlpD
VRSGATGTWRLFVLIIVLLVVAPATLAAADSISDAERELERNRQQQQETRQEREAADRRLESARRDLHHTSQQVAEAQEKLNEVVARLQAAEDELQRLEGELEAAIEEHETAIEKADAATRQLISATQRLQIVVAQLAAREVVFESRVAATYKYGTVTYAQVLVDSKDFEEFLTSYYYVRSAMGHDQTVIDEITALTQELVERRAEVSRLRDAAQEHEIAAEEARQRVAGLTAEQRTVTQQISAERNRQSEVTAELRAAQGRYEAQVADLERESNDLAAELQSLASDESARAAEIQRMRDERRREEEARAAAAAASSSTSPSAAASGSTSSSGGGSATGGGNCQAGWTPKQLAWPSNGCVTSGYGYRTHPIYGTQRLHTGIDIPAPTGQAVYSATEGYVVSAGWRGGYGLTVVIDHGGGIATLYAHLSSVSVSAGQYVTHAQHVGGIGSTGQSTGPHLHFEVRVNGTPQNPMNWY